MQVALRDTSSSEEPATCHILVGDFTVNVTGVVLGLQEPTLRGGNGRQAKEESYFGISALQE